MVVSDLWVQRMNKGVVSTHTYKGVVVWWWWWWWWWWW